jgi:hypothetical protein
VILLGSFLKLDFTTFGFSLLVLLRLWRLLRIAHGVYSVSHESALEHEHEIQKNVANSPGTTQRRFGTDENAQIPSGKASEAVGASRLICCHVCFK